MPALSQPRGVDLKLLALLVRPLVKFCLRRSLFIHDLEELAKKAFVELASEEIRKTTTKINVSRISVLTGLYRKDVARILEGEGKTDAEQPHSILGRVIGQWEQDRRFQTRQGEPRVLSCDGPDSEFRTLVEKVSKHVNSSTVLFELQRSGAVELTAKGAKLVRRSYSLRDDALDAFGILAQDIDTLIQAVEENVDTSQKITNLHIRTDFDNIYESDLPAVRKWLASEGRAFHKRARKFLARHDKDLGPERPLRDRAGASVTLTAFSLTKVAPTQEGDDE